MDEFIAECPRFRILTAGKTGVGKTSLIKEVFKVETMEASSQGPGVHNINEEINSPQNDRFVLHDSQGFEPGEVKNLNNVMDFIHERNGEKHIKDRLHAVWYCIQIPHAGGRLLETGDEEFLKTGFGKVPIIIVFTQYDKLVNIMQYQHGESLLKMDKVDRGAYIEKIADDYFKKECTDKLNKGTPQGQKQWVKVSTRKGYEDTIKNLFKTTEELVRNHVVESVWVASAAAQRIDIDVKVENSIKVGMSKYWRSLATSAHFAGNSLNSCLKIVHEDITKTWNFSDSEHILDSSEFRAMILQITQDLSNANATNPNSGFSENLDKIESALDVAATYSGPVGPIVATVGLSVMFGNWIFGMYTNTPGVLRSLMGYIVDLTLVLEALFSLKLAQPKNPTITIDDATAACSVYNKQRIRIHWEIREYVDKMTLLDHAHPDRAHEEVERLIRSHRLDILGIGADQPVSPVAGTTHQAEETTPNTEQPTPTPVAQPAPPTSAEQCSTSVSEVSDHAQPTKADSLPPKETPWLKRITGSFKRKTTSSN